uniref:Dual oxidase maturation factor 1 n=1 Tax=Terrapene triunguis TaxID=2587831 RepID=A0A674JRY2_9SAUR
MVCFKRGQLSNQGGQHRAAQHPTSVLYPLGHTSTLKSLQTQTLPTVGDHEGSSAWCQPLTNSTHDSSPLPAVQFTGDWETGQVTANTSYKSFSRTMVNADVGLHIGLGGVNVTLVGNPVNQINETINYNEHFAWRFGVNYNQIYNEGLEKGLPSPILYVAEKFSQQSPCGVYSQYRISGHYASATLWVAFCAWLISNMLFSMPVLVYGGYMILVTGAFMIFSLLSFSTVRNSPMCAIQFGPASLQTVYGASFWLTLATSRHHTCFVCTWFQERPAWSPVLFGETGLMLNKMYQFLCTVKSIAPGGGAEWAGRPLWDFFSRLWVSYALNSRSGKNSHSLCMFPKRPADGAVGCGMGFESGAEHSSPWCRHCSERRKVM